MYQIGKGKKRLFFTWIENAMCTSVDEGACVANSKSAGFQAVLQRSAGVGKRLFYNVRF